MGKKTISWKTKGMNRDMSASAFNPEFAFENVNMRLATNEGNTMMSWVNERGTKEMVLHIDTTPWLEEDSEDRYETALKGTVIGTAVINHKLVLFTTDGTDSTTCDNIYVLEISKDSEYDLTGMVLFRGNIGLSKKHPIETLVSYESENIQKVYWTDNKNQPRVVNIVPSRSTETGYYNNNSFDFIQELQLNEEVTVEKLFGSGEFPAGVIQYAFTYYNKYRQETNIFYTTPLQYISYPDRGGAPDSKIANSFKIVISNLDNNFEYLRLYSILRTSKDGTPFAKRVQDIEIIGLSSVTFIDNGLLGESIDPTELLYKGGDEIRVKTMEQKDGTLFLGSIQMTKPSLEVKKSLMEDTGVSEESPIIQNNNVLPVSNTRHYKVVSEDPVLYFNTLVNKDNYPYEGASCFKSGEYYRLGVQFQYKTGQWSEPCWIGDMQCEGIPKASKVNQTAGVAVVPGFWYQPSTEIMNHLYDLGYRKIRPLFAVPSSSGRTILCQGIGCPTMYQSKNRTTAYESATGVTSTLYGVSSWLFRTPVKEMTDWNVYPTHALRKHPGGYVTSQGSLVSMYTTPYIGSIVNGQLISYYPAPYMSSTEIMGYYDGDDSFNVDGDLITINSPEIDNLDDTLDFENCSIYTVGAIHLDKTYGDMMVQTSSPPIGATGKGFNRVSTVVPGNAAVISGILYNDNIVNDIDSTPTYGSYSGATWQFPIYMWHRSGSLNNDVTRSGQSAALKKKIISNYRVGGTTTYNQWYSNGNYNNMSAIDMQVFNSNEVTTVKVNGQIYEGNVDTAVVPSLQSPYYLMKESGGLYSGGIKRQSAEESTNRPVVVTSDNEISTHTIGGIIDLPIPPIDSITGGDSSSANDLTRELWMLGIGKTYNYSEDDLLTGQVGLYYAAADTSTNRFNWYLKEGNIGEFVRNLCLCKDSVSIKYKSTPHVVAQLEKTTHHTHIYSYVSYAEAPVLEIIKPYNKSTFFGGTSDDIMKSLTWIPCGPPVRFNKVPEGTLSELSVDFKWGDSYFQRWECLKTYPFTSEDINQVVEIASFMIETRINIDGRYDKNRGQTSNLYVTPQNFNLINPVYSQMDNFFSYKMLDEDDYKNISYPNAITWTKTKESGADVDLWTNITLASTLEMDGNKGKVNKLVRFNNQLLSFQDKGISQILYNEQTQITTTEGVPLEISNSEKVQGKRYFSDTVGCSNKWSIIQTPSGIYFMDSNDKSIYLFNGQLTNLSTQGGFNSWAKQNIPSASNEWTPESFDNFVTYYDPLNQDVLFINKETALAYSEKFSCFTSFYDYEGASYFNNLDDIEIWVKNGELWKHQAGNYCNFFSEDKPFSMTLIGNQEPQIDKIFTNMEFRACVEGEGTYTESTDKFSPLLPFDTLEVWDEYQHGLLKLTKRNSNDRFNHSHTEGETFLNRKFRMWRCDIPRDNAAVNEEVESIMGIKRFKARPLDRIRNPWAYLKLKKEKSEGKTEVHDIMVSYFG